MVPYPPPLQMHPPAGSQDKGFLKSLLSGILPSKSHVGNYVTSKVPSQAQLSRTPPNHEARACFPSSVRLPTLLPCFLFFRWEELAGDDSLLGHPSPSLGRQARGCRETFQMSVLAVPRLKTSLSASHGLGAHLQRKSGWRGRSGWRSVCHVCTRCVLGPERLERVGFCVQSQRGVGSGGSRDMVPSKAPPSLHKNSGTENGWHSVIRGLRKKGCEAEASLGYIQSSRSDLASKIEEKKKKRDRN